MTLCLYSLNRDNHVADSKLACSVCTFGPVIPEQKRRINFQRTFFTQLECQYAKTHCLEYNTCLLTNSESIIEIKLQLLWDKMPMHTCFRLFSITVLSIFLDDLFPIVPIIILTINLFISCN